MQLGSHSDSHSSRSDALFVSAGAAVFVVVFFRAFFSVAFFLARGAFDSDGVAVCSRINSIALFDGFRRPTRSARRFDFAVVDLAFGFTELVGFVFTGSLFATGACVLCAESVASCSSTIPI